MNPKPIEIRVLRPLKTATRYEIRCQVKGLPFGRDNLRRRLHALAYSYGSLASTGYRFGFEALNFRIRHHELWDGIFALFALTRVAGPLFGLPDARGIIRFDYAIDPLVADFYLRRAANLGSCIDIDAPTRDMRFDGPAMGHTLPFGGGKESRLVLGLLRELGIEPEVHSCLGASDMNFAADIPTAKLTRMFSAGNVNRTFSALMACPAAYYSGAHLCEVGLERPWQNYYDMGAPLALKEFSTLLGRLGLETSLISLASVLPATLVQQILHARYPNLFAHQFSIPPEKSSVKNLHISLIQHASDIDFSPHCSEPLFRKLLGQFVRNRLAAPEDHGPRNCRRFGNLEMQAIINEYRADPLFRDVREQIPESWAGRWHRCVHDYANPWLDAEVLAIYRQHAPMASERHRFAAFLPSVAELHPAPAISP